MTPKKNITGFRAGGRQLTRWTGTVVEAKKTASALVGSSSFSDMMRWIVMDLWRFAALTEDQLWRQRNTNFAEQPTNKQAFQMILSKYRRMGLIEVLTNVNAHLVEVGPSFIGCFVTTLRAQTRWGRK